VNIILKQILITLIISTVAASAFARTSKFNEQPVSKRSTKSATKLTSVKKAVKASNKAKVKSVAKTRDNRRRIIEIDLAAPKAENDRQPASVNAKAVAYVPARRNVSKRVVSVEILSEGLSEDSYDALREVASPKKSCAKNDPKAAKVNAEIDNETLNQAAVSNRIGEQTMADPKTLNQIKKSAEKEIDDDYL
jgi:hypothetical protein